VEDPLTMQGSSLERGSTAATWSSLRVLRPQRASAFGPIVALPSHKMLIKKPVQGLSYCSGIRAVVGMEPSASNERLDFALA